MPNVKKLMAEVAARLRPELAARIAGENGGNVTYGAMVAALPPSTPEHARQTVTKWEEYDLARATGAAVMPLMRRLYRSDAVDEVAEALIGRQADDEVGRELARRQYARLRDELIGPDPNPIERLMAERVAVCWLDAHLADQRLMRVDGMNVFSVAEVEFFARERDRAHRRYVSTLEALHRIRARALPALRLSLAVRGGGGSAAAVAVVETSEPGDQIEAAELCPRDGLEGQEGLPPT